MKTVAVFLVIAFFSAATLAATARTVTNPQGNANEQSVNAVAGPPPAPHAVNDKSSAQPSKKALRKSKIRTPPPLHDPN